MRLIETFFPPALKVTLEKLTVAFLAASLDFAGNVFLPIFNMAFPLHLLVLRRYILGYIAC